MNIAKLNSSQKEIELALAALQYSESQILMNLRFLDVALSSLVPVCEVGKGGLYSDGNRFIYDPKVFLYHCGQNLEYGVRSLLHVLMHGVFRHAFFSSKAENKELFTVCADMAAEAVILELRLSQGALPDDAKKRMILDSLKKEAGGLSAQKLYMFFQKEGLSIPDFESYKNLFFVDSHDLWITSHEVMLTTDQWEKIARRVKTDLATYNKGRKETQELLRELGESLKERHNYEEILRKFAVSNEDIHVNDEEFDYIYYAYGLEHYGNMPLIEPLEYKESHKIKDFVIVIDTSASVRGDRVSDFVLKTCEILSERNSFFSKMNVHIIQCDNQVRSDYKVTCPEDLKTFLETQKLTGFGATDFRPAFDYVTDLMEQGEFEDLKGLIYFTDGYGSFPQKMPPFETMFVLTDDVTQGKNSVIEGSNIPSYNSSAVTDNLLAFPGWAMKVVLENDI